MRAERWQRLQDLFHRVVDVPAAERPALLDRECAADPELRAEVERLLQADEPGTDPFSRLEAHTHAVEPDTLLDRALGPWRLTERIGAGGMGVVYRGRRADGAYELEVAIKLIRAETAPDWMLRRFEFERRTLAALQHPCIARLLDGGTTADGYPWFVMDLVAGEPIDRYCKQQRLPLAARLRLFLQVCQAVQFAHQNLVVHCDLKPGNILVDTQGRPRLLDFGIARLLDAGPVDADRQPTRSVRLLTLEYASPEQLAGSPVTTAHDVYSLGVVLYELATDRRLFANAGPSAADWERTVRDRAPERPSSRVVRDEQSRESASVAAQFRSTPGRLRRALRGDLDRIVLMALRKEPDRRYASVQDLAADIERHLGGLPVRARDNSFVYRASKFVQRNRVAVGAVIAVVLALASGLVAARRSAQLAHEAAIHAATEADSFQSIADFLMDTFLPAQPAEDLAWQQRARERIQAQAERVHRQHQNSPHERANLLDMLGQVCTRLDLFDLAEQLARQALAIREQTLGADSLECALSLRTLGQLEYRRGQPGVAIDLLTRALAVHRAAADSPHADPASLANDLAACLRSMGRNREAEELHRQALARRRAVDNGSLPVAESLNNLACVHMATGDFRSAAGELRESLAIRTGILGPDHALALQTSSNLAASLWRLGEHDEARNMMLRSASGFRTLGKDGEDGLGLLLVNLATAHIDSRDFTAAAAALDEALGLQRRRLGDEHPQVVSTRLQLAGLLHRLSRVDEALQQWTEVVRARRNPAVPRGDLAVALHGHAVGLFDLGQIEAAERLLLESVDLFAATDPLPIDHGRALMLLARCCARRGDATAAHARLTAAIPLLESGRAPAEEVARARAFLAETERQRSR